MEWKSFENPPIREAVFDIKFTSQAPDLLNTLEVFNRSVIDEYPNQLESFKFTIKTKITGPSADKDANVHSESHTVTKDGYRLSNSDNTYVILISTTGFSLSRLGPYESWDNLKGEAKRLLLKLLKIIPDIQITRIALRYINDIKINPGPGDQLRKYLTLLPILPSNIPNSVEAFAIRLTLPNIEKNLKAIINQELTPNLNESLYNVVLDIDVYKEFKYQNNIELILNDFEDVRNYKNTIFFNTITDFVKSTFELPKI